MVIPPKNNMKPNVEFSLVVNTGENYKNSTFYRQPDPRYFEASREQSAYPRAMP